MRVSFDHLKHLFTGCRVSCDGRGGFFNDIQVMYGGWRHFYREIENDIV